jgi:hypothetical protein
VKFKALSYIEVKEPNKKYRDFLIQPFDLGNLFLFADDSDVLFMDWKGTDMRGWYRFVNPNTGVVLEFHKDEYKIKVRSGSYKFPHPKTLNDFISDCNRVGITLYWYQKRMDELFELRTYLDEEESKIYYKELLTKIEKENVF